MTQATKTRKARAMTYTKPKLAYDVETFKRCFSAVFRPIADDSKSFIYVKQRDMNQARRAVQTLAKRNPHRSYQLINEKEMRFLVWEYQLIGFNNGEFDDYMLQAILDGKSTREVYELAQLVVQNNVRLWTQGHKAVFGTFDIRSVVPLNISLKQLASEMGYRVWEFDDVEWDHDEDFTLDQLVKMLDYDDHDTFVTGRVFAHHTVFGAYNQHVAFIENYLPGCDWMISRRDASLAEAAITNRGEIKIEQKREFDFMLNGRNVLSEVPREWRNEYYRYAKDVERAFAEWEKLVESGVDKQTAYEQTLSEVPLPQIDVVWLDDFFGLQPSAGGIHSVITNHPVYKPEGSNIVRAENVEHFDIGGAYGATARAKNVYGAAQERYNRFMDDKFRFKNAGKSFAKNPGLSVGQMKAGLLKHYGIDLKADTLEGLERELKEGVSATKLGTNSPTGKADSPTSGLYNPIGMIEVRLILQCLFYDIMKKLIDAGCVAFSANTDGFFIAANGVDVQPFIDAWEAKWGLELDYDHIDLYIAKDDNNRILIEGGKVLEATGDDLLHQEFNPKKSSKKPRVVDNVLLRKVIDPSLDIRELLEEYVADNRVDLFAWTLKATQGHVGVINRKIAGKINRVLLTTEGDEIGNYSTFKDKVEAFTYFPVGTPVQVINGDLPEELPANLNLDAYQALIEQVYERWI